jgi:SNF2 family DNA or RNA helicase
LIVHPEIVMVQAWYVCTEIIETKKRQRNKRTGVTRIKTVMTECGKRTEEGSKQKQLLICGHTKTRKTKHIIAPGYPKLFDIEWGAIIVDESHESLIRRTGTPTQRRRGLDMLKLRGDGIKLAMSGTPFDSKPHQLWGTLNWLDPTAYGAYHRWAELYWRKGGFTGFQIGEFRKDREAMLWDSLSAVALRRTKAEVAPDLPPKMEIGTPLMPSDPDSPVGIWLEMDGKQAKAYEEMEKLSVTELDSGRLEALSALAELTRLKQLASSYGDIVPGKKWVTHETRRGPVRVQELHYKYIPRLPSNKFNWIVENLEEWGYPKDPLTKVVIVSFYTGILELFQAGIEKHFKTKPAKPLCTAITGRTPIGDRRKIIDRFNKQGTEQVMLLNVKAGGTAITLDTADRMIFVSETRIPDQQKQAEDRIHRVSNPRHCMYYYLRSLGTVDVGTSLVNQEMIRDGHRLLDARRGVEYTRHVMELSNTGGRVKTGR